MKISLLGPLEVSRDGAVITPSAPKLRRVLSLLVVQANNVVRTDQIIEELWEDNPPTSVVTTLQTYIYQLRKLLQLAAPPGARPPRHTDAMTAALHTSANGYVLSLAPDALDSLRFEWLADRGRAELEAGEVETSAATLSEALRLWRGPALVDVSPGPVLQAEVLRLEEMHKTALERRIEADLQLGRHHEMLSELTRLAAQQPTHEGFQAKLMLALYRAGRRSEALHAYQRTRSALATELGLDPSSDLQRLHRAVLAADRSLDPPSPATKSGLFDGKQPPRQLPPEGPPLVGRQPQLAEALGALSVSQRRAPAVVVVVGPPGSGKSALCTKVGHLSSGEYPDGQLYARLLDPEDRPVDPGEVLAEFLRSAGFPDERIPASTDERCRMFRTWTADRRVLVALDDVMDTGQLLPLLPASGDCGVLVTSRRRLSAPAVTTTVELRPLHSGEGFRLLVNVVGVQRVGKDENAAKELVQLCDGLPSALHAAAARLQLRPHWPISRLVRQIRGEIDGPAVSAGPALHASVGRTYRLAPPAVRTAFRLLTALDTPAVSLPVAARALDVNEGDAESLLEDLAEFQLVEVAAGDEEARPSYRFFHSLRAVGYQLRAEEEAMARGRNIVPLPIPRSG